MRSLLPFWFLIFRMFSSWIPLRTFLHHWCCGIARWCALAGLFSFIVMDTQRYLLIRKFILVSSVLGNFLYCCFGIFFSIIFCFPFLELLLVGCWTSKIDFWLLYFCSCCPSFPSLLTYFVPFESVFNFLFKFFTDYFISIMYLISESSYVLWLLILFMYFITSCSFFMCNLFSVWILNISYFEIFFSLDLSLFLYTSFLFVFSSAFHFEVFSQITSHF